MINKNNITKIIKLISIDNKDKKYLNQNLNQMIKVYKKLMILKSYNIFKMKLNKNKNHLI